MLQIRIRPDTNCLAGSDFSFKKKSVIKKKKVINSLKVFKIEMFAQ